MRKHRIDLNLIYDHNPSEFLSHLQEFVTQVNSVEHFNLFLSNLRDEDTTRTIFFSSYTDRREELEKALNIPTFLHDKGTNEKNQKKKNLISDSIRPILEKVNRDKYHFL